MSTTSWKAIERVGWVIGIVSAIYSILTLVFPNTPMVVRSWVSVNYAIPVSPCNLSKEYFKDIAPLDLGDDVDFKKMEESKNHLILFDRSSKLRPGDAEDLRNDNVVGYAAPGDVFKLKEVKRVSCFEEGSNGEKGKKNDETKVIAKGVVIFR